MQPIRSLIWPLHRLFTDRLGLRVPFSRSNATRILALSVKNDISQAQIFSYFDSAKSHGFRMRETPINDFMAEKNSYGHVDEIYLQTWFDLTDDAMNRLLDRINAAWPNAGITYLDWFAPSDLRYAKVLNPRVTAYVKKQILSDFSQYGQPTLGDTNLTDWCARRFHIKMPMMQFDVPASFQKKLKLGPGFEYSPAILTQLESPLSRQRTFDVHARIGCSGTDWYTAMRMDAKSKVDALPTSIQTIKNGHVSRRTFFKELRQSKICFSPFGYGEVCWRDFEAMSCGAVLIKPDMSHLKLAYDVFIPNETYVPVKWDLTDFREKVGDLLASPWKLNRISENAYNRLRAIIYSIRDRQS